MITTTIIALLAVTGFLARTVFCQTKELAKRQKANVDLCIELADMRRQRNFYHAKSEQIVSGLSKYPDDVDDVVSYFSGPVH